MVKPTPLRHEYSPCLLLLMLFSRQNLLPFSDLTGKTVVVADILRATTTITFAVANGATAITPVLTPEDAFRLAADQPNTLIGGERRGVKVDGFDLGNSPREYTQAVVSDRQIALTTTNGTRTLQACRAAGARSRRILPQSPLNCRPVGTRGRGACLCMFWQGGRFLYGRYCFRGCMCGSIGRNSDDRCRRNSKDPLSDPSRRSTWDAERLLSRSIPR